MYFDEYNMNVWKTIKKIVKMMREQEGDYSIDVQTPIMILDHIITLSIGTGKHSISGHYCQDITAYWGPTVESIGQVSANFIYRHSCPSCEHCIKYHRQNINSLTQLMKLIIKQIEGLMIKKVAEANIKISS
jgi:hypothetical protein